MTAPRIGFVLLTHAHPGQVLRLAERLLASFDGAPIVCHHDFSQSPLDVAAFPAEVRFVQPHVRTRWGDFSVVEAILAAIRELYERGPAPGWFALLSGADYPLRSAAHVLSDLENTGADVYVQHARVDPYHSVADRPPGLLGSGIDEERRNRRECLRRYFRQTWTIPLPGFSHPIEIRTSAPWIVSRLAPYSDRFRCYAGATWFTANRRAARYLLDWHARNPWLARHLRKRFAPDESYPHTIFCNAPELTVSGEYFRYVDWSAGGAHPKTLGVEDLPRMLASRAHFGRKFAPGSPALREVDALLDSGPP